VDLFTLEDGTDWLSRNIGFLLLYLWRYISILNVTYMSILDHCSLCSLIESSYQTIKSLVVPKRWILTAIPTTLHFDLEHHIHVYIGPLQPLFSYRE